MSAVHRIIDPTFVDSSTNEKCALAVMTKAPRAGHVKTRLVPPLTYEEAARLNSCFLRDTTCAIADVCGAQAHGVAVYTPVGAENTYNDMLPDEFELLAQRGEGFGERLINAATDLFRIGFASVCLIDSDSPTVANEIYARAIQLLSTQDDLTVLGPSDDGGYYLIGMKAVHPDLFQAIDWSTERVLKQTQRRAASLALEVKLLPACYDVDDRATLRRLCEDLLGKEAKQEAAPRTQEFLRAIISKEGRDRIWPQTIETDC
jgi:rSAM/selenodomain-associated transferase 1